MSRGSVAGKLTLEATFMKPPRTPSLVAGTFCQYAKLRSYLIGSA
jgi:hypothetical protein